MLLFLRPFWKFLKKAIDLDIDLDIKGGVIVLVLALSIGNKQLFKETWTWELNGKAVEESPGEFDELPAPQGLLLRATSAQMKRPKVRLAPAFIPLLTKHNLASEPRRDLA